MKIPIPQDWNGDEWECIEIQWPRSVLWRALLLGLLSYPMRGRYWDERTGQVTDAQDTGREIWYKNTPLVSCRDAGGGDEDEPPPPFPDQTGGSCWVFGSEIGEDDMPCLSIAENLKIENGILYARNGCCEWVAIGSITTLGEAPPPDLDLGPETPPVDYKCRKAEEMAQQFVAIAAHGWEIMPIIEYQWIKNMRDNYAELDLSLWQLYVAHTFLFVAWAADLVFNVTIIPARIEQELICRWQKIVTDKTEITDSEFDKMKDVVASLVTPAAQNYLTHLMDAIGKSGFTLMATAAIHNDTANCDCPSEIPFGETTPSVDGWYLSGYYPELRLDASTADQATMVLPSQHDVFGVVLSLQGYTGGDEYPCKPKLVAAYNCASAYPALWDVDTTEVDVRDLAWGIGQNEFNQVLGQDSYTWGNSGIPTFGSIGAPIFAGGQSFSICVQRTGASTNAYARVFGIRLLHNINSPSHGT